MVWATLTLGALAGATAGASRSPIVEDAVAVTVLGIRATKEVNAHVDPKNCPSTTASAS